MDYIPTWCADERCGQPQEGSGHPRVGWVRIKVAGDATPPVWFCSPFHAAVAMLGESALAGAPRSDTPGALRDLNRLAGTFLSVATATPRRVRAAMERALTHVLADMDEWQARQDRERPTAPALLAELAGGDGPPMEPDALAEA